jgi:hypothetical protein
MWLKDFKDWVFGPSVKAWLSVAFKYIVKILGSPQAEQLFIDIIAASLGLPTAQVKLLWDFIAILAQKAEDMFPGNGNGDAKYAMVSAEFKAKYPDVPTFRFDVVLHNFLAFMSGKKFTDEQKTVMLQANPETK